MSKKHHQKKCQRAIHAGIYKKYFLFTINYRELLRLGAGLNPTVLLAFILIFSPV